MNNDIKCIIARGREYSDPKVITTAIYLCPFASQITTVISGGAAGVDKVGERWARHYGFDVIIIEAKWVKIGGSARPKRNAAMAVIADALIAIPGRGPGTRNMMKQARERGLRVFVYEPWRIHNQDAIKE